MRVALGWLFKLFLLVLAVIGATAIKYFVLTAKFNTLYDQFYYLKNIGFYNVYLASEDWLTTQRLTHMAFPDLVSNQTAADAEALWSRVFAKIDRYSFILQFADMMVLDEPFAAFHAKLLNGDNCELLADGPVTCSDELSTEVFACGFRANVAMHLVVYRKFQIIFNQTDPTKLFTDYVPTFREFASFTSLVYPCAQKELAYSRSVRGTDSGPGPPLL